MPKKYLDTICPSGRLPSAPSSNWQTKFDITWLSILAIALNIATATLAFAQNKSFSGYTTAQVQDGEVRYRLVENADFPGNDFRSSLNDRALKSATAMACLQACSRDGRCQAFTYNTRHRACFLKSKITRIKGIRGAISGQKLQFATSRVGQNTGNIEPNGLNQNQKNALEAQLKALGHFAGQPDGTFDSITEGAIRGYQQARGFHETGKLSAEELTALMRERTYGETLINIEDGHKKAVPTQALLQRNNCGTADALFDIVGRSTSASLNQHTVTAGNGAPISYNVGAQTRSLPIYFIASFDSAVHIQGAGLYALTPNARAPFGLSHEHGKTRVVVPLSILGARQKGKFNVTPLLIGDINIRISLVAPTACGERIMDVGTAKLTATLGQPQIVLIDEFEQNRTQKRYIAADGNRIIEDFGGRFRVIDAQTGIEIAEHAGREPRFSQTGRFIASRPERGIFNVHDAVNGMLLQTVRGTDVVFDNKDSFLIVGGAGNGSFQTFSSLVSTGRLAETATSCRPCSAAGNVTFKIDLENNVVVSEQSPQTEIKSITTKVIYDALDEYRSEDYQLSKQGYTVFKNENRMIAALSGFLPFRKPSRLETLDALRFTHNQIGTNSGDKDLSRKEIFFREHLLKPIGAASATPQRARPAVDQLAQVTSLNSRSRSSIQTSKKTDIVGFENQFINRLNENFNFSLEQTFNLDKIRRLLLKPQKPRYQGSGIKIDIPHLTAQPLSINKNIIIDSRFSCTDNQEKIRHKEKLIIPMSQDFISAYKLRNSGLVVANLECTVFGTAGYALYMNSYTHNIDSLKFHNFKSIIPYFTEFNPGPNCENNDCDFHMAISHSKYILIWSKDKQAMEIHDMVNNISRYYKSFRGELLSQVYLSNDAKHLVQLNDDGTFALHEVSKGYKLNPDTRPWDANDRSISDTALLYGRYADDELVVWNDRGHYDATFEGAAQVFLRFPGASTLFTFDQFAAIARIHGLADKTLNSRQPAKLPSYRLPPILSASIERMPDEQLKIHWKTENLKPVSTIHVYQDGVLTNSLDSSDSVSGVAQTSARKGVNWISIVAEDPEGIFSAPTGRLLRRSAGGRTLRAIFIGIDTYYDKAIGNLSFAKTDAFKMSSAISATTSPIYDSVIQSAYGDTATAEAILKDLASALSSDPETTDVLLFIAGHGVRDPSGEFYLAMPETDLRNIAKTALPWRDIATLLADSKSKVMVFLDTCHSGDAGRPAHGTNDDAVASLLSGTNSSITIFSASRGREESIEAGSIGGGVFTAAVIDILKDSRTKYDQNKNNVIEVSELYGALRQNVHVTTKGQQSPWLARNRMVGEFAIF